MARKSSNRFTAPAQKYAGQVKVGGGPVPLQRWTDKDRKHAGEDLRGEERSKPHPKENGSARPK